MIRSSDIVRVASDRTFNAPVVMNVYRSVLVEAIVSLALPDWEWCSADYAAYDFRHKDGTRLEVKQTALRQSWVSKNPSPPSWDIKPRTGAWRDGNTWVPGIARNADIYVFGLHPELGEVADHRDPGQWVFYVIATKSLPSTQRLSVTRAERITASVRFDRLSERVDHVKQALDRNGQ